MKRYTVKVSDGVLKSDDLYECENCNTIVTEEEITDDDGKALCVACKGGE